jgi:hypothetical protein
VYHRRYERGQRTSSDGRRHCPKMPGLGASDRTPALNPVYHTGMSGGPNTILYNAVRCPELNMISQKYACHPPCVQQFQHEKPPTHLANTNAAIVLASLCRRTMTLSTPQTTTSRTAWRKVAREHNTAIMVKLDGILGQFALLETHF